jgi:hypothetical protein
MSRLRLLPNRQDIFGFVGLVVEQDMSRLRLLPNRQDIFGFVGLVVSVEDMMGHSDLHCNLQLVVLMVSVMALLHYPVMNRLKVWLVSLHMEVLNRQDMVWDNCHSCQVLSRYHSSIVLYRFLSSNSVQMGLMASAVAVVFPDMPDRLDWRYNQRLVLSVLVL